MASVVDVSVRAGAITYCIQTYTHDTLTDLKRRICARTGEDPERCMVIVIGSELTDWLESSRSRVFGTATNLIAVCRL